jgi:hypothetical protein
MKFYRIKQTGENKFIPQIANDIFDWLFGFWGGMDVRDGTFTWLSKECQDKYCVTDSLEKAKKVIGKYQETFNSQKGYPKYHKL